MKALVVLAHPTAGSFNHAIARTAAAALSHSGHEPILHDLYAEGFDPVLPTAEIPKNGDVDPVVREHCRQLSDAEGIVIVHPNWWGQPPAILKGWVDRVVRPGVAYEFGEQDSGEGVPIGLLRARGAVVFNTANTPAVRESKVFGDPLETLWRNCVFGLCGVEQFHRRMFGVICTSTRRQREAWLDEVTQTVRRLFPPT